MFKGGPYQIRPYKLGWGTPIRNQTPTRPRRTSARYFSTDKGRPQGGRLRFAADSLRWREKDSNLYGAFPVKSCFGLLPVLCSERESRSSSGRLRSGSRSARKGSRDRNGSKAWRLAALASLVFRSALMPEHAEGR